MHYLPILLKPAFPNKMVDALQIRPPKARRNRSAPSVKYEETTLNTSIHYL